MKTAKNDAEKANKRAIEYQDLINQKNGKICELKITNTRLQLMYNHSKENNTTASDEKIPTVPAILENRPNITMVTNTTPQKTTMSPKTTASPIKRPVLQPKLNIIKPSGYRKL